MDTEITFKILMIFSIQVFCLVYFDKNTSKVYLLRIGSYYKFSHGRKTLEGWCWTEPQT